MSKRDAVTEAEDDDLDDEEGDGGDLDEAEDEDEDSFEEEDDDDGEPGPVTVERLRDLDDWEMFRLVDEDELATVCTLALRPDGRARVAEYAIWREGKDEDEPGSTGKVDWLGGAADWDDATREDALRQIVYRYEEDIAVPEERLAFRLAGPPPGWEDDADDGHEEDDDDEDDE